MMQTVRGIYKDGRVEFINSPPADVDQIPVLITFLVDEHGQEVDLQKQGIGPENAMDLRNRLKCFADDWERPEMDAYDKL
ncbi:hypothetical protein DO021_12770 [Desulfobacter hydrogenophilus]|uniref:Uncharacterized protein n=2 Tax=Desulfobacter hydrogenophilus TaxID=2291 RepID=A0A328FD49_9BACT|nr:hypothetical protein [Desulfobacter hydrogenophilus]QBH15615.1 hypothetical protein EYB58_14835 [Desulfobacter hydrogenophilus]RAM01670.1 hypothetical protein DO021_12770 [Desulfobacter hydrogenophilus]